MYNGKKTEVGGQLPPSRALGPCKRKFVFSGIISVTFSVD